MRKLVLLLALGSFFAAANAQACDDKACTKHAKTSCAMASKTSTKKKHHKHHHVTASKTQQAPNQNG